MTSRRISKAAVAIVAISVCGCLAGELLTGGDRRPQGGPAAAASAAAPRRRIAVLPAAPRPGAPAPAAARQAGSPPPGGAGVRRVQHTEPAWGVAPPASPSVRVASRTPQPACVQHYPCGPGCSPDSVSGCGGSERTRMLLAVPGSQCGPEPRWGDSQQLPFEVFGPGEYIGPVRQTPVQTYRLRIDDVLRLTYLLSRDEVQAYRLQIGDQVQVQSAVDPEVNRTVDVMPDGRVSLHLLGYVHVAGQTIPEMAQMIEQMYIDQRLIRTPKISVTGLRVNTRLSDIQATVDNRQGQQGGTGITTPVMPDGTINLVGLPQPICCQGLTVMELQEEINARYREQVGGLMVTVALSQLAPKFVYVMGEVASPDRYQLQGPTRVSQALALAGGPLLSGNQRQIVIVRHTPQWGTVATKLDLRGFLLGKRPAPSDDLWVRDNDIVLVPKNPIQQTNELISLLFTNGLYAAVPELSGFTQTNLFGIGTLLGN